jgi:branched-chain amino acid transport system ATP-binding protein
MDPVAAMTLLSTSNLCRSFGGLKAVSSVTFKLDKGEIRAIIGPNGAGKTTFVSLIAGRLAPDAGRITFLDEDITGLPAFERVKRGIGYTFQVTSIFANLDVLENVRLAAAGPKSRRRPSDAEQSALTCLDRVGLADRAGQLAGTLSYGHQRLLEVAMGLAIQPRLLILDEPTQGLSDAEISNFIQLVKAIGDTTTVLIIEHNMPVVMSVAQTITVLDRGRILAEGAPEEIRSNLEVQHAYLGVE